MSLKNFHLFFIAAAVALSLLCGILAVGRLLAGPSPAAVAGLAASCGAAVMLARYEARFLRRCRARGLR